MSTSTTERMAQRIADVIEQCDVDTLRRIYVLLYGKDELARQLDYETGDHNPFHL